MRNWVKQLLTGVVGAGIFLMLVFSGASSSQAVNLVDVINVYVAPPLAQGTHLSSGITVENFNSYTAGACPTTLTIGTVTGGCQVAAGDAYGGAAAAATVSTPTAGGSATKYATTTNAAGMTFSLAQQSRYVGFWWSAGGGNNFVTFYQDNTEIVSLDSQDLRDLFGTAPTNAGNWLTLNADSSKVLTAADGSTYPQVQYFGNPRGYSASPPTAISTITSGEPFVYVHLFAKGNLSFNKIKFSGLGFEFDNLVVAEALQSPPTPNNLVLSEVLTSPLYSVRFEANGGDGSMPTQFGSTATNLNQNTFTRPGYTFGGWANSQANATAGIVAYTNGQSFAFTADATLYAIWSGGPELANTGEPSNAMPGVPVATSLVILTLGALLMFSRRRAKKR